MKITPDTVLPIGDASIYEEVQLNLASEYLVNNYERLKRIVLSKGIKLEKAYDLLNDVYVSLVEDERNNKGYDESYSKNSMSGITLEQFVTGRVNLYTMNYVYRTDSCEEGTIKVVSVEKCRDINGRLVSSKKNKVMKVVCRAASSYESEDEDGMSEFQIAYRNANSANDEIGRIDANESIREQIDYCIDICSKYDIAICSMFKNLDKIAGIMSSAKETVFDRLREVVKYNDEFGNVLKDVLEYSSEHRDIFERIIAEY